MEEAWEAMWAQRQARRKQEEQKKALRVDLVTTGQARTAEVESERGSDSHWSLCGSLGDGGAGEERDTLPTFTLVTRQPTGNTRGGAGQGEADLLFLLFLIIFKDFY